MRVFIVTGFLIFVPGLVFAAKECSSIGGTCKYSCAGDESLEQGYFRDCDYRQVCCTSKKTGAGEKPAEAGKVPQKPKDARPSAGPSEPRGDAGKETVATPSRREDKILVCTPLKESHAFADTLLQCGDRNATLKDLYEEDYRLIQILNGTKALYYLEKTSIRR